MIAIQRRYDGTTASYRRAMAFGHASVHEEDIMPAVPAVLPSGATQTCPVVIPSEAPQARRRGIAVVPIEGPASRRHRTAGADYADCAVALRANAETANYVSRRFKGSESSKAF